MPAIFLVTVTVIAAGCTGPAVQPAALPSIGRVPDAAPRSPSVTDLPGLVLTADLSERPGRWKRILLLPFGPRVEQLGYKTFPQGVASQPSSFAIAPDGSFWIDDRWKARLVHYSSDGRYLGSVHGLRERGEDVETCGNLPCAIAARPFRHFEFFLMLPRPSGGFIRRVATDGGRAVIIDPTFAIPRYPANDGLIVHVTGYSDTFLTGRAGGPVGYARIDVGDGQIHRLPGLPGGPGSWLDYTAADGPGPGDQEYEFRFLSADQIQVQPIHFKVVTGRGSGARSLTAEVGVFTPVVVGDDIAFFVMLSPARASDAGRYGGGRWLLRIGRSPVLFERLPDPGIPDEPQRRHLAIGPDGHLYLMVARRGGVEILQRP